MGVAKSKAILTDTLMLKHQFVIAVLCCTVVSVPSGAVGTALAQTRSSPAAAASKPTESVEVTALKKDIAALRAEVEKLKEKESALEFNLDLKADSQTSALLNTDTKY